jgi:uncharacterized membrane protein YfcA
LRECNSSSVGTFDWLGGWSCQRLLWHWRRSRDCACVGLPDMEQHKAQGTSLGALLLPVGLLGFLEYYRNGEADIKVAALVAIGLFIGAFIDAYLAQLLSLTIMRRAFGLLLVAIGLSMVLRSA